MQLLEHQPLAWLCWFVYGKTSSRRVRVRVCVRVCTLVIDFGNTNRPSILN